jgi:hypothetical protein
MHLLFAVCEVRGFVRGVVRCEILRAMDFFGRLFGLLG